MIRIFAIISLIFLNTFALATQTKGKFASESAINRAYAISFDSINNVIATLVNLRKVKYQNQEDDLVKVSTNILLRISESIKALNTKRKNQKLDIQVIEKLNDEMEQLCTLNSSLLKLILNDRDGHDYECESGDCQRDDDDDVNLEPDVDESQNDDFSEDQTNLSVQSIFQAAISDELVEDESIENDEEFADEVTEANTIQSVFSTALNRTAYKEENDDASISIQNIFKKAL